MVDKSIIGKDMGSTVMQVERGKVIEFARATLDDNPIYFSEEKPPVQPTYTLTIAHWPRTTEGVPFGDLGLELTRILHAGQEFEYLGEIRAGDTLTAKGTVSAVYEKEGKRGGKMEFVEAETTFTNQRGEVVLKSKNILVQTSKAAS